MRDRSFDTARRHTVGDEAVVLFSVADGASIGRGVDVGPFARFRPGTALADAVHVGSYVEIKGSTVGTGSKVPHLSYVGDTDIGAGVNVGAATVTVNYDGYRKHAPSSRTTPASVRIPCSWRRFAWARAR